MKHPHTLDEFPPETENPDDTIVVTYLRLEYELTWKNFWNTQSFMLWILVALGLLGLTGLGVIAWWAGFAVIPVVFHLEFTFPLTLFVFLIGVLLYSAVWIYLIGRVSVYAANASKRLVDPRYPTVRYPTSDLQIPESKEDDSIG